MFDKKIAVFALIGASLSCSFAASADDDEAGELAALKFALAPRGDYGFTLTQSCVRTPFQPVPAAGFDPVTHRLLVDGELINTVGSGVMHFAKDGAVTVDSTTVTEISASQLLAGALPVSTPTQFTCAGNFTLQGDRRLAVSLACDVPSGRPGVKVTVQPLDFAGFIGVGARAIDMSSNSGGLHTVTVAVGGTPVQQRERICLQSMKLDKL